MPLVFSPPRFKEFPKIATNYQHWFFIIDCGQAPLDPLANGISMNAKHRGNLFNRIGAMNFDEPIVRMTFALGARPCFGDGHSARDHAFAFRLASIRRWSQS